MLRDKVSIVTGGASGIGYSVARALVQDGARVVIADVNEEKLKEARHRLALYIQAMKGLSPLDKLNQGYSYVEKEGKAITSVQDVKEGDLLEICVSDGKITARAEKTSAVSWMEQS